MVAAKAADLALHAAILSTVDFGLSASNPPIAAFAVESII
jgi:hypothetical protein